MVRRGSPVRVRQRAFEIVAKRGSWLSSLLVPCTLEETGLAAVDEVPPVAQIRVGQRRARQETLRFTIAREPLDAFHHPHAQLPTTSAALVEARSS